MGSNPTLSVGMKLPVSILVGILGGAAGPRPAVAQAIVPVGSAPRVTILSPPDSEVFTGRSVPVVLQAEGVDVGTAHYELFLDRDLTPMDSVASAPAPPPPPAPAAAGARGGVVAHLTRGRSWHTFEGVLPGSHRLIAVLADPKHVPLKPLAADTVVFVVRQRRR